MKFRLSGAIGGILFANLPQTPNFTITARVSGPITEEGLRSALDRLPQRHPMLAVRGLLEQDGTACFTTENVQPIPLRVVARTSGDDWIEQVKLELEQPFHYLVGPPFRCTWLQGQEISDLILVCDHVTSDALAGIYVLRDLLELLADPTRSLEMLPPPRLADRLPQLVKDRATALNAAPPPFTPPGDDGPPPSFILPPLNIFPIHLSKIDTDALVACCRANGVTLQAALSTAFLLPFAEQQPDSPVRKVEVPVNLRSRLSQPIGEAYGVYIALMVVDVNCTPGRDVWETVRSASNALAEAVKEERYYNSPVLMVLLADHFPPGNPFATDYDISISNLGRVDIPEHYGPFHLASVYAPTMMVIGPEHRILGVTTFAGQLRATLISRHPQTPQLVARARELLAEMIG